MSLWDRRYYFSSHFRDDNNYLEPRIEHSSTGLKYCCFNELNNKYRLITGVLETKSVMILPWWSNSWDSMLPVLGACVWSVFIELDPTSLAATKDTTCFNEDGLSCMPWLNPGTAKKKKKIGEKYKQLYKKWAMVKDRQIVFQYMKIATPLLNNKTIIKYHSIYVITKNEKA